MADQHSADWKALKFLDEHEPSIKRMLERFVNERAAFFLDDLMQDLRVKILEVFRTGKMDEIDNKPGYCFQIARNDVAQWQKEQFKKLNMEEAFMQSEETYEPKDEDEFNRKMEACDKAMEFPRRRLFLEMRAEGKKYKDIASDTRTSIYIVKRQVQEARKEYQENIKKSKK